MTSPKVYVPVRWKALPSNQKQYDRLNDVHQAVLIEPYDEDDYICRLPQSSQQALQEEELVERAIPFTDEHKLAQSIVDTVTGELDRQDRMRELARSSVENPRFGIDDSSGTSEMSRPSTDSTAPSTTPSSGLTGRYMGLGTIPSTIAHIRTRDDLAGHLCSPTETTLPLRDPSRALAFPANMPYSYDPSEYLERLAEFHATLAFENELRAKDEEELRQEMEAGIGDSDGTLDDPADDDDWRVEIQRHKFHEQEMADFKEELIRRDWIDLSKGVEIYGEQSFAACRRSQVSGRSPSSKQSGPSTLVTKKCTSLTR